MCYGRMDRQTEINIAYHNEYVSLDFVKTAD